MQDTNVRVIGQLKEKLSQVIATGKLKTRKPVALNAAKRDDPTKPLQQALAISTRIVAVQGVIPRDETLRRLETIRQHVHPFGVPIDERSAKVTALRRAAETCQNYLATVATAIRENDIDVTHLKQVTAKMATLIKDVIKCVEAYNTKDDPKAPAIDETLNEAKMQRLAATKSRLVSCILKNESRMVVYVRMPVLAIFDPAVRTIDLQDAGLSVEGYDGLYSVVIDQQVIGIATDTQGKSIDKLLGQAIHRLSNEQKTRLSLVSDQPTGIQKYGMKFYWVADPRTLQVLDNVKGNHVQVAKWSFPF